MRAFAGSLLVLAIAGCGDSPVATPEPDPLTVTVTARYINTSCTIEWKAVASDDRIVQYHVGFGDIDNPRWHEEGTFFGTVTEHLPGPAPNKNVTFLLEAEGYRRAANVGPSGQCF